MSRRYRRRTIEQRLGRVLVALGRQQRTAQPVARPLPTVRQQLLDAGLLEPLSPDPEKSS